MKIIILEVHECEGSVRILKISDRVGTYYIDVDELKQNRISFINLPQDKHIEEITTLDDLPNKTSSKLLSLMNRWRDVREREAEMVQILKFKDNLLACKAGWEELDKPT